jgi:hypothetical protein
MTGTDDKRPYAAPANVIGVVKRSRTRNLPDKVDSDFIRLAGVPEAVVHRVASALKFLGLVTEDDKPSDTLRALAAAPDEQYREILAGAIRSAYQVDFARIDPAQDSQKQIIDAFRPYQPRSQTDRMVILFLGLCREAGIEVKDAPRERPMNATIARTGGPARASAGKADKATSPKQKQAPQSTGAPASVQPTPGALLFGVTEDDIGVLDEEQFATVWNALGVVARARAQAHAAQRTAPSGAGETPEDVDGEVTHDVKHPGA